MVEACLTELYTEISLLAQVTPQQARVALITTAADLSRGSSLDALKPSALKIASIGCIYPSLEQGGPEKALSLPDTLQDGTT